MKLANNQMKQMKEGVISKHFLCFLFPIPYFVFSIVAPIPRSVMASHMGLRVS